MEQELQKVNSHNRLVELGRRVEVCRNSGRKVSTWYAEQGIAVSTYYNWQRKVFQAVFSESEVYFAKFLAKSAYGDTAGSIQCEELRVDIRVEADAETNHTLGNLPGQRLMK